MKSTCLPHELMNSGNHGSELRTGIYELLTRHGYVREFEDFSFWDDWYYLA
jgi:hypothetical protein